MDRRSSTAEFGQEQSLASSYEPIKLTATLSLKPAMRLLKFFFLAIAFLTVSLAAYCFVQIPIVKKPTPSAVDFLEKNHIETARLSELDKELVAEALRVIRSNDKAVRHAYSNVWQASVFGFLGLGVVSFVLALVAHRQTRSVSA